MYSIYHFWKHLVYKKSLFPKVKKLSKFSFSKKMLSSVGGGLFPDLAIKLNQDRSLFTGGELIELKDSKSYSVSSFNSTVPTGKKNIRKIISSERGKIFAQMRKAGDDIYSLEERDVYYLIRGRKNTHQKICLVHGSFFETISAEELISKAFAQVLDEKLNKSDIPQEVKETLGTMFSEQADFSKGRSVEKASVKLRFRVMTEVKPEGNILDPNMYPKILDDTLNLIVPYHNEEEKMDVVAKFKMALEEPELAQIKTFPIKHPFNGWFVVFQVNL
jgi:hypothetical protein